MRPFTSLPRSILLTLAALYVLVAFGFAAALGGEKELDLLCIMWYS